MSFCQKMYNYVYLAFVIEFCFQPPFSDFRFRCKKVFNSRNFSRLLILIWFLGIRILIWFLDELVYCELINDLICNFLCMHFLQSIKTDVCLSNFFRNGAAIHMFLNSIMYICCIFAAFK